MHHVVVRIPSVLNTRVIDSLAGTATEVMQDRTAPTQAVPGIPIDGAMTYRVINGFGFSAALQWSDERYSSPGVWSAKQQQIFDLFFHSLSVSVSPSSVSSSAPHRFLLLIGFPHQITLSGCASARPTFVWDCSDRG